MLDTLRSFAPTFPRLALLLTLLASVPACAMAQSVSVSLTTHNQKKRLAPQRPVSFSTSNGSANAIIVDETQSYQAIEGFGASLTDSSAYLLNRVASPAARTVAMSRLFTRTNDGIGLSFIRNPMGASDLARTHYSYDDVPAGSSDPSLAAFSIGHDEEDVIPLLLQARALNPQLVIMATPWSPPGWMKTSGSLVGGSLSSASHAAFAEYFVRFLKAYEAAGVRIDYVSLQNEPLYVPVDYPGMSMDAADQAAVLRDAVLPSFTANGIDTKILVYDHNWDRPDYPSTVLSDPEIAASTSIAGVAWHGYGGTPGAMSELHEAYPNLGTYVTENSGGAWISDQVTSDFETITQSLRNWSRSYVKWGLALDQKNGPHDGGCGTCTPLVTVSSKTGAVTPTIDYYTLGHFSRFVQSGARRVYTSNVAGVIGVAFVNPDGSRALVAFNDSPKKATFSVRWGSKSFPYKLAGRSGATFTWMGSQDSVVPLDGTARIQASSLSASSGLRTEVTADTLGGFDLGYADDGDFAVYRNVELSSSASYIDVRVACGGAGGAIEVHLDAVDGPLVANVPVTSTGGWQNWRTLSAPATSSSGRHDLYVVFRGGAGVANLNWFELD